MHRQPPIIKHPVGAAITLNQGFIIDLRIYGIYIKVQISYWSWSLYFIFKSKNKQLTHHTTPNAPYPMGLSASKAFGSFSWGDDWYFLKVGPSSSVALDSGVSAADVLYGPWALHRAMRWQGGDELVGGILKLSVIRLDNRKKIVGDFSFQMRLGYCWHRLFQPRTSKLTSGIMDN